MRGDDFLRRDSPPRTRSRQRTRARAALRTRESLFHRRGMIPPFARDPFHRAFQLEARAYTRSARKFKVRVSRYNPRAPKLRTPSPLPPYLLLAIAVDFIRISRFPEVGR